MTTLEAYRRTFTIFPDCKSLIEFLKRFEEDLSKKDLARKDENDDTTESGKFDFQSMKNKERNDADVESLTNFEVGGKREAKNGNEASSQMDQDSVHPSLNEDDKVGDSSHATGVDSIIEGDVVELTEFEDVDINEKVEKEKQQIGNEESSSQMDQDSVNPSLNEDDKVAHSSHATGVDSVTKEDVDINEKVEKEKEEIGNEESNSQMDHVSIKTSLNEDDKVVDDSVTTIPDSVTEGTREKLIKNDNVLVDDVLHPISRFKRTTQKEGENRDMFNMKDVKFNLETQMQAWRKNPVWDDGQPPGHGTQRVSLPTKCKSECGLAPDAIYNIVTDPDNKRVFKNIQVGGIKDVYALINIVPMPF
ncbi:hypothetical protein Tco_0785573 [Tanacetum coccineum]